MNTTNIIRESPARKYIENIFEHVELDITQSLRIIESYRYFVVEIVEWLFNHLMDYLSSQTSGYVKIEDDIFKSPNNIYI